jgi:hypothetical protein
MIRGPQPHQATPTTRTRHKHVVATATLRTSDHSAFNSSIHGMRDRAIEPLRGK